jgi:hypothetical protein
VTVHSASFNCSTQPFDYVAPSLETLSITADPSASSCSNVVVDGPSTWIFADVNENVTYTITGPSGSASKTVTATQQYTSVAPGSYSVTATAHDGYTLMKGETSLGTSHTWTDLVASDSSDCQLPPHAVVTPQVSWTAATCSTDGSYTLGLAEVGEDSAVIWTVNGKTVVAGTYSAPAGTKLTIVATAVAGSGISGSEANFQEFTVTIPASSVPCDYKLATLAFTGVGGDTSVLLITALLLLLAGAGVFTASRLRTRES